MTSPGDHAEPPRPRPHPLDYAAVDVPPLPQPADGTGPVVALDVDGVINYFPREEPWPPGVFSVEACIPAWATARAEFLVGHGRVNLPARLTVDLAHGAWIRSLLDRGVTVVWCTTWETAAPVVYGALLDIPPLPVVQMHPQDRLGYTSIDCKELALRDLFPRRPLVWLDDHLISRHAYSPFRHPTWPTLVRPVNPSAGLDQAVRDEVDAWLARHPDGTPAAVEFLEQEHDSSWRITTDHGTARLRSDGRVLLGRTLRAHLGIQSGTRIYRDGWIAVGEPLPLALGDRYSEQTVLAPEVRGIELLHHNHRDILVPHYQALPDLRAARADQEAAQRVADTLPAPAPTDLVVRRDLLRAVVDDVTVTVELDADLVTLSTTPVRGARTTIAYRPASSVAFIARGRATSWRSVLVPAATLRWAMRTYHEWRTRQTCPHRDAGGPYCPDCGQALDVQDPEPGRDPGKCAHGYDHPEWAHACDGCCTPGTAADLTGPTEPDGPAETATGDPATDTPPAAAVRADLADEVIPDGDDEVGELFSSSRIFPDDPEDS